jgi:hypothetical protein
MMTRSERSIAMLTRLLTAGALAGLITRSAIAQERVDNPEYANWAKFKKGTSLTRVSTSVTPTGNTSVVTETLTLVEIAADKVVVEVEYVSEVTGATKFKTRPKTREIPKTVPLPPGMTKEEFTRKLPGTVEEGTETLKMLGEEFKTRWYKTKTEVNGNRTEGKTWASDEVPGRIVKVESTTKTKDGGSFTTSTELAEIKKP